MKLSNAVDAILETWSGSDLADLDANSEYVRGEVELIVELHGRQYVHDDLGVFNGVADDEDFTARRIELLTEHIRDRVRLDNENFADVVARQGWNAASVEAILTSFIEAMVPVCPGIKRALVAHAQDIANQENAR